MRLFSRNQWTFQVRGGIVRAGFLAIAFSLSPIGDAANADAQPKSETASDARLEPDSVPKPLRPRVVRERPPPRLPDDRELALMEHLIDLEPDKLRRLIGFLQHVEQMSPEEKEQLKGRIEQMRTTFKKIGEDDRRWLRVYIASRSVEERREHFAALRELSPDARAAYLQQQLDEIRASGVTYEELRALAKANFELRGGRPQAGEGSSPSLEDGEAATVNPERRQRFLERMRERQERRRPSGLEPPPEEATEPSEAAAE
ncbi:MAG: hypothetical protein ACFBZ8_00740 [Opitutales bacterium]